MEQNPFFENNIDITNIPKFGFMESPKTSIEIKIILSQR